MKADQTGIKPLHLPWVGLRKKTHLASLVGLREVFAEPGYSKLGLLASIPIGFPSPHSPFTLYCWKLLLEGVLVLWIEAAEA